MQVARSFPVQKMQVINVVDLASKVRSYQSKAQLI